MKAKIKRYQLREIVDAIKEFGQFDSVLTAIRTVTGCAGYEARMAYFQGVISVEHLRALEDYERGLI